MDTTMAFPRLFDRGRIGSLDLRNRIVMTAMGRTLVDDSTVTDRQIAYYEERAKGGAGLIVTGGCQINEGLGKLSSLAMGIGEDRLLPKLRELAMVIRRHGAAAGIQLVHAGSSAEDLPPGTAPVSASAFPAGPRGRVTRELTIPEIREVEHEFARAALRAKEIGFQLVELNCCSGYLIREFLSPRTNKRQDEYGGALENRLRFLLEVIATIQGSLGRDFPLLCRLTGDEFLECGHKLDEAVAIARAVAAAGVAAISVTVGGHETAVPLTPGLVPPAAYAFYARQIRRAVNIPVIYATRVNTPQVAEDLLRDGTADFVGMMRPLNADPYLPRKAAAGKVDEIVPCVACHQGCYDQMFSNKPLFCLTNPQTAFERERQLKPVEQPKRVLVIGGGPGGMQAAVVAARRGHRVTLVERSGRIGGQLNVLSEPPGKHGFRALLSYLKAELSRHGVEVILGREAAAAMVAERQPDAVVLATGSAPAMLPVPGTDLPHVHSARDVLTGEHELGERVVVVGGNAVGIETALYAATRGAIAPEAAVYLAGIGAWNAQTAMERAWRAREVTVLEMLPRAGGDLGRTTRWSTMMAARSAGINVIAEAKVVRIDRDAVWFEKDGESRRLPADTVVIATGARPNGELAEQLAGRPSLHVIGDAAGVRNLVAAIHEGFLAGNEV